MPQFSPNFDVTSKKKKKKVFDLPQTDPAPRGAYRGRAPPNENCAPPKRGLCPEEINRLGASGAKIEVQISVFCGLTPDFVTFLR